MADLSRRTGLPHPTTRRILRCLMEEQLVAQNEESRRYQLGPLLFELGLCAPHQGVLVRTVRPALERLSAATGDTVYLMARSGTDAVCLDRVEGTFPIRVVTTGIGDRRPLGIGAAGLAILAHLDETEINTVIRENRSEYERHGLDPGALQKSMWDARARGYGVIDGLLTPGVAGVGWAIMAASGSPIAGISVASVTHRVFDERLDATLALLKHEVGQISRELHVHAQGREAA